MASAASGDLTGAATEAPAVVLPIAKISAASRTALPHRNARSRLSRRSEPRLAEYPTTPNNPLRAPFEAQD
jgi:hypothetical protein